MNNALIRKDRKRRKKELVRRVLYGDAKKMARDVEEGGIGRHYTTITRFLKVDESFWSDKVEKEITDWLDKRDEKEQKPEKSPVIT